MGVVLFYFMFSVVLSCVLFVKTHKALLLYLCILYGQGILLLLRWGPMDTKQSFRLSLMSTAILDEWDFLSVNVGCL